MKKRLSSFLAGMLTMALIGSLAIPVLASAGMTITVDPINVQVNGQTFAPKDVKGNSVPVFAYNGTTYAPLRALAEAYGLEVGYDSKTNMATVAEPGVTPTAPTADYSSWSKEDEAAYQEFKGMWTVLRVDSATRMDISVMSSKSLSKDAFEAYFASMGASTMSRFALRYALEYKTPSMSYASITFGYDDDYKLYLFGVTTDGKTAYFEYKTHHETLDVKSIL